MAITRRQFMQRSGLVAASSLLGPRLFGHPLVRRAFAGSPTIGDRYLVVIFLDGGNDGLNTVIPVDGALRPAYEAARSTGGGGIRIVPGVADMIGLDSSGSRLALHPGLNVPADFFPNGAGAGGLTSLYGLGHVAVVQGAGYPAYSLSHAESRVIWQTGSPLNPSDGSGWVGRHLAYDGYYEATDIPGVNIADSIAGEFKQSKTSVLAVRDLAGFTFPFDGDYPSDIAAKQAAFLALTGEAVAGAQPRAVYLANTGAATLNSSVAYQDLSQTYVNDRGTFNQMYQDAGRGRSAARDLREVAKVIYGVQSGAPNVSTRFFQLSNGGYDTHSDQGGAVPNGQHFGLHAELGAALRVFHEDLSDMGVWDDVCVVVWSEFSRRIEQNGNGTDHGSQGPMFVIGGKVNGGVYGNHPNIDALALDDNGNTEYTQSANPFRSTDFRDVYGTVLKHWVNMPAGDVGAVLPADSIGDPAHYWETQSFDLKRGSDDADMFQP